MSSYGYSLGYLNAGFTRGMGATATPVAANTQFDYFIPSTGWGLWGGTIEGTQAGLINRLLSSGKFNSISASVVSNKDGIIGDSYAVNVIGETKVPFESQAALEALIWDAVGFAGLRSALSEEMHGSFIAPGTTNILGTLPAGTPAVADAQHGIQTILGDPNLGDYDVIYSDPNAGAGIFNQDGYFYSGNQDGVDHLAVTTDYSGNDDGYVAFMKDGSEVYFDIAGNFVDSYIAPSAGGGAGPVITPGMTTAQIAAAIKAYTDAAKNKGENTLDKLAASLGLTGVGAALGIGAGTLLIVVGVVAYGIIKK